MAIARPRTNRQLTSGEADGEQVLSTTSSRFLKNGASTGTRCSCVGHWLSSDGITCPETPCPSIFDLATFAGSAKRSFIPGHPPEGCAVFCKCFCTAVSLNSGASRSIIFSAPVGHSPIQAPSPSQKTSFTSFALPFTTASAPSAQPVTQAPQPLHFSSSISIILRFMPFLHLLRQILPHLKTAALIRVKFSKTARFVGNNPTRKIFCRLTGNV